MGRQQQSKLIDWNPALSGRHTQVNGVRECVWSVHARPCVYWEIVWKAERDVYREHEASWGMPARGQQTAPRSRFECKAKMEHSIAAWCGSTLCLDFSIDTPGEWHYHGCSHMLLTDQFCVSTIESSGACKHKSRNVGLSVCMHVVLSAQCARWAHILQNASELQRRNGFNIFKMSFEFSEIFNHVIIILFIRSVVWCRAQCTMWQCGTHTHTGSHSSQLHGIY